MNEMALKPQTSLADALRREARAAPESGIVEAMNYGRDREGMIPLWAGEGDLPTPAFISEAATRSLAAGETFYTWQRGIPPLREALARYHTTLYGRPFLPEEFYVTGSGMQAIQIVLAMVAGAGDEVVIPTPTWPNAAAATGIMGARAVEVPMTFGNDGWSLDFDRLAAAVTPKTRALFLVSPSNPTGWTASREDLRALLALARHRGLWIIADETYARFWYGEGARAVVLRCHGGRGSRAVRQHVLQKLGDDRLAHRLDRGAPQARSGDREYDPVFDLGGGAVHAARRRHGDRAGRELRHAPDRARAARA
jgi:aspartate/methionine/tyrosine aminotransferase